MRPADWPRLLLLVPLLGLCDCASMPEPVELQHTTATDAGVATMRVHDQRARFREIFCSLARKDETPAKDAARCEDLLWKLSDESPLQDPPAPPLTLSPRLRIFVVSGAFGDCRQVDTVPYGEEIERLAAQGVKVRSVMVSGRSSAAHNARQIAEALQATALSDDEIVVLVGYSKGAVDILQFVVDFPQLARRVGAVVSVAGPISGSPLASTADWWYREWFSRSFAGTCDPGDGGVITSLRPDERRKWLDSNPLPARIQYFSLAAFTTREHLSRGLALPWHILARTDARNDGQVLIDDAVIPDGTLLGYVNADHWDIALSVERQLPYLSERPTPRQFPRNALFEAMLLYVSDALVPRGHALP